MQVQKPTGRVSTSSMTLFNDIVLDAPIPQCHRYNGVCYPNNAQICTLIGTSVDLEWSAVTGATHYVVQTCGNSQFIGPTLRTYKIAATVSPKISVYAGVGLNVEVQYFWRVMPVNTTGGAGPKSDPWTFQVKCDRYDNQSSSSLGSQSLSSVSSCVDTLSSISLTVSGANFSLTLFYCDGTQRTQTASC
jgi:hypothetical protein